MGLLTPITGNAFLKGGFLGFPKSGKTYTAALLLCAVREHFKDESPIAFFDTEGGSTYIAPVVKTLTGKDMLGVRARSFDELMQVAREVKESGIKYLLVDSITHPWRELCETALKEINDSQKKKGRPLRAKLEFQDWGTIKAKWEKWTTWYLNSGVHIVICGRAGFEYDFIQDDNGRKQLEKTGIRMKTESEFGFEPSLLVYMDRISEGVDDNVIYRSATVLGDRFNRLDGASVRFQSQKDERKALDAVAKFFAPHITMLGNCEPATISETVSEIGFKNFDTEDRRDHGMRKEAAISGIELELKRAYPTQNDASRVKRNDLLREIWPDVNSAEELPTKTLNDLVSGLDKLRIRVSEILA